jgi:hypothetical protein
MTLGNQETMLGRVFLILSMTLIQLISLGRQHQNSEQRNKAIAIKIYLTNFSVAEIKGEAYKDHRQKVESEDLVDIVNNIL